MHETISVHSSSSKLILRLPDGDHSQGVQDFGENLSYGYGPMASALMAVLLDRLYVVNYGQGFGFNSLWEAIGESFYAREGIRTPIQIAAFNEAKDMLVADGLVVESAGMGKDYSVRLNVEGAYESEATDLERKGARKKSGCVYLIEAVGTGRYKIGETSSLNVRDKDLQRQSPFLIKIQAIIKSEDTKRDEGCLHDKYAAYRVHGEWFELSPDLVKEIQGMAN